MKPEEVLVRGWERSETTFPIMAPPSRTAYSGTLAPPASAKASSMEVPTGRRRVRGLRTAPATVTKVSVTGSRAARAAL